MNEFTLIDEPDAAERAAIESRKAAIRAELAARPPGENRSSVSRRFWRSDPAPQPSTPAEHARRAIQSFRRATRGETMIDRADKASRYRGVYQSNSRTNPWAAKLGVKGRQTTVGSFATEDEAARAYDQARVDVGREPVNFPNGEYVRGSAPPSPATTLANRNGDRAKPTGAESSPAILATQSSLHRELTAAAAIAVTLASLEPDAARRVLDFVGAHYHG